MSEAKCIHGEFVPYKELNELKRQAKIGEQVEKILQYVDTVEIETYPNMKNHGEKKWGTQVVDMVGFHNFTGEGLQTVLNRTADYLEDMY